MAGTDEVVGEGAVVAGFDGTDRSRAAVRWAAREARATGRRLVVVYAVRGALPEVVFTPTVSPLPQVVSEETVREYAHDKVAEVATEVGGQVEAYVLDGHPAQVLEKVTEGADLLVVGASGSGALARSVGSVAADVVTHAPAPVVVVRDGGVEDGPVVVGVDGSETSAKAIDFAFDFAARHGLGLVAVHAWTALPLEALSPVPGWEYDPELFRSSSEALLREALAGPEQRHPEVAVERVTVSARPAEALLEHADRASLVVVGSHGRGLVRRALLGSVSHALLHNTPGPLAVVRA
ncbi:universal stress protein [Actinosynnema sp. NPDC020468]|uniref:universal stress protein n=1 Tax=Actinosynnema sp. NPDC020468 TaxID=3154488 RepID=UPI0033D6076F